MLETIIGEELDIQIRLPDPEHLRKYRTYTEEKTLNKNMTLTRINKSITTKGGVYFLYDKERKLLYIGKSANIRQRMNGHTRALSAPELDMGIGQRQFIPENISWISWIILPSPTYRDIIETAYISQFKPDWNIEKIF